MFMFEPSNQFGDRFLVFDFSSSDNKNLKKKFEKWAVVDCRIELFYVGANADKCPE